MSSSKPMKRTGQPPTLPCIQAFESLRVGDCYQLVYWDVVDEPSNTLNFDGIGRWDQPSS